MTGPSPEFKDVLVLLAQVAKALKTGCQGAKMGAYTIMSGTENLLPLPDMLAHVQDLPENLDVKEFETFIRQSANLIYAATNEAYCRKRKWLEVYRGYITEFEGV